MNSLQKVIKYLALALAIILIVSIFKFIINGLFFIGNIFDKKQTVGPLIEKTITLPFESYNELNIDTKMSNLTLKLGERFSIVTNNNDITIIENKNTLHIKDNNNNFHRQTKELELIITLPHNYILNTINIESGVGSISIEELIANNATLDLGIGELEIDNINITERIKIEGGTGKIIIHEGNLNNLSANLGIGEFNASLFLIGNNKINSGIGQINLNLLDNIDSYTFNVEKGIGNILLNNNKITTETIRNGQNLIDISGGIGEIIITTAN